MRTEAGTAQPSNVRPYTSCRSMAKGYQSLPASDVVFLLRGENGWRVSEDDGGSSQVGAPALRVARAKTEDQGLSVFRIRRSSVTNGLEGTQKGVGYAWQCTVHVRTPMGSSTVDRPRLVDIRPMHIKVAYLRDNGNSVKQGLGIAAL